MKNISKKVLLPILLLGVLFCSFLTLGATTTAAEESASPCNWKSVSLQIFDTYVIETHHCIVGGDMEECVCGSTREVKIPRIKPVDPN
jgi:hypothetical protein